eukprot:365586-Chlamydomonas_euryale.AAC.3
MHALRQLRGCSSAQDVKDETRLSVWWQASARPAAETACAASRRRDATASVGNAVGRGAGLLCVLAVAVATGERDRMTGALRTAWTRPSRAGPPGGWRTAWLPRGAGRRAARVVGAAAAAHAAVAVAAAAAAAAAATSAPLQRGCARVWLLL